jgi:hypothetical protein
VFSAVAQDGLRMPGRAGSGIDPSLAGGWLSQERDRFGYSQYHWRDAIGFAPTQRMQWSYAFGQQGSVGMSVANGRDFAAEPVYGADARQYGLVGRYSLAPDWSLSAETVSREPGSLFRLNDFRIGLRRSF